MEQGHRRVDSLGTGPPAAICSSPPHLTRCSTPCTTRTPTPPPSMPHDEMAKPVLHVVGWGAEPSAWQALLGAAHVGTCGVVVPRCAATAGSCSGEAPAASYQELLAVKPWRRIGVLVRAGARRRAVGRIHAGHQLDRQLVEAQQVQDADRPASHVRHGRSAVDPRMHCPAV
jgi:hypothetical protein